MDFTARSAVASAAKSIAGICQVRSLLPTSPECVHRARTSSLGPNNTYGRCSTNLIRRWCPHAGKTALVIGTSRACARFTTTPLIAARSLIPTCRLLMQRDAGRLLSPRSAMTRPHGEHIIAFGCISRRRDLSAQLGTEWRCGGRCSALCDEFEAFPNGPHDPLKSRAATTDTRSIRQWTQVSWS